MSSRESCPRADKELGASGIALQCQLLFLSLLETAEPKTAGLGGLWGSSECEKERDVPSRSGVSWVRREPGKELLLRWGKAPGKPARGLWGLAQSGLPRGSTVASAEAGPRRAAGRISEAPLGDGLLIEEALEVSGEQEAREALFLGMAIGGLADEAAVLGETAAGVTGAGSGVLGGVSDLLSEATSAPLPEAALVPSSVPSCWLS